MPGDNPATVTHWHLYQSPGPPHTARPLPPRQSRQMSRPERAPYPTDSSSPARAPRTVCRAETISANVRPH